MRIFRPIFEALKKTCFFLVEVVYFLKVEKKEHQPLYRNPENIKLTKGGIVCEVKLVQGQLYILCKN